MRRVLKRLLSEAMGLTAPRSRRKTTPESEQIAELRYPFPGWLGRAGERRRMPRPSDAIRTVA